MQWPDPDEQQAQELAAAGLSVVASPGGLGGSSGRVQRPSEVSLRRPDRFSSPTAPAAAGVSALYDSLRAAYARVLGRTISWASRLPLDAAVFRAARRLLARRYAPPRAVDQPLRLSGCWRRAVAGAIPPCRRAQATRGRPVRGRFHPSSGWQAARVGAGRRHACRSRSVGSTSHQSLDAGTWLSTAMKTGRGSRQYRRPVVVPSVLHHVGARLCRSVPHLG